VARRGAPDEQCDNGQTRHRGQQKQQPQTIGPELQKDHGQQRAERGAQVIHRARKAEGPAESFGRAAVGNHGIARRGSDSLADAVAGARGKQMPRRLGQARQRTSDGRQNVTKNDERLAMPDAIGPPAGPELEQAGSRIGHAFNGAQLKVRTAQHVQQKTGMSGIIVSLATSFNRLAHPRILTFHASGGRGATE